MIKAPDGKAFQCREILLLLSEYLDAELPSDICDRVAAHLHTCKACMRFIDSLRNSIALCKELECELIPNPLPEDLRQHLRQAYEAAVGISSDAKPDKGKNR